MAGLLLLLCVVSVGAALGIVYLLYGPAPSKPLVAVPRASLTVIPQHHAPAQAYNPEAVFALEQGAARAGATRAAAMITPAVPVPAPAPAFAPVEVPAPLPPPLPAATTARAPSRALPPPMPSFMRGRVTSPPPLHRARAARGTDSPRSMPATPRTVQRASDSFVDIDPTMIGDETMAS